MVISIKASTIQLENDNKGMCMKKPVSVERKLETLTFEYLAGGQGFEDYVRSLRAVRRKRKEYETQKVLYVACVSFAFLFAFVFIDLIITV
jgi:hypothetical protein